MSRASTSHPAVATNASTIGSSDWVAQERGFIGEGVRQLWETSTDDGKTWTVAFDGIYRRAATPSP
jgi:hypothetical protein